MGNLTFNFMDLPDREKKPRRNGLTLLRDFGMGYTAASDLVEDFGEYIDFMKMLHFTVLYHQDNKSLAKKVRLYRDHGIDVFPGGIVFETAIAKGKVVDTLNTLQDLGFNTIECSDNIISFSLTEKLKYVELAINHGFKVIVEVGSKYPDHPMQASDILEDVKALMNAGVSLFIVEKGEIDLYFKNSEDAGKSDSIDELIKQIGLEFLTFEAETLQEQAWFIKRYGNKVNLGPNINPQEIAFLEGLRRSFGREIGYTWLKEIEQAQ